MATKVTTPELLQSEIYDMREQGIITSDSDFFRWDRMTKQMIANGPPYPDNRPFWQIREEARKQLKIYPPFGNLSSATLNVLRKLPASLYVHPAKDITQPAMVAFTKGPESGERDIQMVSRVGKLLRKYLPNASDREINDAANEYTQMRETQKDNGKGLIFLENDPEKIINAYKNCTTSSCMSYSERRWALKLRDNDHLSKEINDKLNKLTTEDGYIHPAALYAYMEDVAVAIYSVNGRIVSRVVVNTLRQQYTKVYGNDFIRKLLENEGYTQGQIWPTRFPAILTTSNNIPDGILAPYVDGTKDRGPKVQLRWSKDNPYQVIENDVEGVPMRAYSEAALPFDIKKCCAGCGCISSSTKTGFGNLSRAALYCTPCIGEEIIRANPFEGKGFGFGYDNDGIIIVVLDDKENFIPHNNPPTALSDLGAIRSQLSGAFGTDLRETRSLLRFIQQSQDYSLSNSLVNEILDFASSHIHKTLYNSPVYVADAVHTDRREYSSNMEIVEMPDGSMQYTATRRMHIISEGRFISQELYVNGAYPDIDELVIITDIVGDITCGYRKHCVDAIINQAGETRPTPRENCTFAVKTGKWFNSIRSDRGILRRFMTEALTAEGMEGAYEKYGREIMHAKNLVDNCYPRDMRVALNGMPFNDIRWMKKNSAEVKRQLDTTFNTWTEWHEEIHASTIFTQVAPLLDLPTPELEETTPVWTTTSALSTSNNTSPF